MKITENIIQQSLAYESYRNLIESLFKEGKSTGITQSEELLHYSELNIHRMNRVEKTTVLNEDLKVELGKVKSPQIWLVLTEGWCGDAAQSIPVFNSIEKSFPNIQLRLVLRDENLDLMDQFLTNGGRAVPKLLILDASNYELLAHWGPRPPEATKLINEMKALNIEFAEIKEKLHLWYAKNRSQALQAELLNIITKIVEN